MAKKLKVALAGNPNSGKTTVFNSLVGGHQHVGNYPGVTVERKEGFLKYRDYEITVVDLPGTYSLTAYTVDEVVARNFLVEEKPDVVVDIIDTANLERNLYLAVQLMELGVPLILAFNMYDLAEKQGLSINKVRLEELLGMDIVPTVATRNIGLAALLEKIVAVAENRGRSSRTSIRYGRELEEEIGKLVEAISQDAELTSAYPARWLAVKLLENDSLVLDRVRTGARAGQILAQVERSINHLQMIFGDSPEAVIADRRYGFISGACSETVSRTREDRHTVSDQIDTVLIHRVLGLPIFLGLMWVMFKFTFGLAEPFIRLIETMQKGLGNLAGRLFVPGSILQSLIVDGVIGGVGSVLALAPVICLLFLALAVLEDSGYMVRAAFIMDRFMHRMGLHGQSFIPLVLGFGCNVPAIMASRIIEDRRDRLTTILVSPFMSCGARLPVYMLFIGAFFPLRFTGNILFSLYLLGVGAGIFTGWILRKYLLTGESLPFVMELPPYRLPTLKGLVIHMWERAVLYFRKAGTVIFAGCLLVWFLSHFPRTAVLSRDYGTSIAPGRSQPAEAVRQEKQQVAEQLERSYAGQIGKSLAPVFKPLGFGDWKTSVSLLSGFVAKEMVVGTLGTLYFVRQADQGVDSLRVALRQAAWPDGRKIYTPLTAYALMVFVLLYVPCVATLAVIRRETNSWSWPLFTVCYNTGVAWVCAFLVYQAGRFLGLGG